MALCSNLWLLCPWPKGSGDFNFLLLCTDLASVTQTASLQSSNLAASSAPLVSPSLVAMADYCAFVPEFDAALFEDPGFVRDKVRNTYKCSRHQTLKPSILNKEDGTANDYGTPPPPLFGQFVGNRLARRTTERAWSQAEACGLAADSTTSNRQSWADNPSRDLHADRDEENPICVATPKPRNVDRPI